MSSKSDNSSLTFDLSKLDLSLLKEIKEVIDSIANEKGIAVNFQPVLLMKANDTK